MEDLEKFVNLTLSLIHPELFQSGLLMLQKLRWLLTTKDVALRWQSVHTGIAIVCNRLMRSHRDRKGRLEWYDSLVNYSGSGRKPRLLIKDFGMDLEYSSGTMVGFCGMIFKHEVKLWGSGDRLCYAHFLKESVRKRLDAPAAGWVKRQTYL